MRLPFGAPKRALITVACTAAALSAGLVTGAGAAPHAVLSLTGATPTTMDDHEMSAQAVPTADNAARWLAGGAILLAAMGVAATLIARRRS